MESVPTIIGLSLWYGGGAVSAGPSEYGVHFVGPHFILAVGEIAVVIKFLELSGGLSGGLAILSEIYDLAGDA